VIDAIPLVIPRPWVLCRKVINAFTALISSLSHTAIHRVHQQSRPETPLCSRLSGAKDLVDGDFADTREVARFFEDVQKFPTSDQWTAARKPISLRYHLSVTLRDAPSGYPRAGRSLDIIEFIASESQTATLLSTDLFVFERLSVCRKNSYFLWDLD
jgi:hypothetical protein